MSYTEDRAAVKRLTREIDRAEADADAWKWERAERLSRMCEEKSQREVGLDTGMTRSTLQNILKVWEAVGGQVPGHRTYTEVYYAAAGQKPNYGGGRNPKEKAATATTSISDPEVAAALTPTQREKLYEALEASEKHPVQRPSTKEAPRSSAKTRNVAALAALADMHRAAQRAVESAVFDKLSDHDMAGAEVMVRATESEIAVWRENVGGGISDAAIEALLTGSE